MPDDDVTTDDVVTLRFPAATERVRLARTLVATLADEAGFDFDQVEDLRIAVDELCFVLIEQCGTDGRIELTGSGGRGGIRVEGRCVEASTESAGDLEALPEITTQILATVVDDYEVGIVDGVPCFRFTKADPDTKPVP